MRYHLNPGSPSEGAPDSGDRAPASGGSIRVGPIRLGPISVGSARVGSVRAQRSPTLGVVLLGCAAAAALAGVSVSAASGASPRGALAQVAAMPGGAWWAPTAGAPPARAAHVVSVKDEGHLHLVSESGSNLVEEGAVTGAIPGRVKVNFSIGPTVRASFTIYARGGGTISGRGQGTLHSTGLYSTFGGSLSVAHGTGRYAHARGTGGLYGAINRKTYAMTVQTVGKLYY
jgi:hypothetical protein